MDAPNANQSTESTSDTHLSPIGSIPHTPNSAPNQATSTISSPTPVGQITSLKDVCSLLSVRSSTSSHSVQEIGQICTDPAELISRGVHTKLDYLLLTNTASRALDQPMQCDLITQVPPPPPSTPSPCGVLPVGLFEGPLSAVQWISWDQLADLISNNPSNNLLLIDSRSFLDYNNCHIQGAINICCSKIVKRRLQQDKVSCDYHLHHYYLRCIWFVIFIVILFFFWCRLCIVCIASGVQCIHCLPDVQFWKTTKLFFFRSSKTVWINFQSEFYMSTLTLKKRQTLIFCWTRSVYLSVRLLAHDQIGHWLSAAFLYQMTVLPTFRR